MDGRPESVVSVQLDALLDTRLGTLHRISPEAALRASKHALYYYREIDDFTEICGIGKEQFREAYAKRDLETLKASLLTEVPFILNELVLKLEQETIDTPFISKVRVEINTYPYELDNETQHALNLAVAYRCGTETPVSCVRFSPEQMTPSFVRGRYSGLILYDHYDWMKAQLKAFETVKMPRISVLAPALYRDEVPSPDEFRKEGIAEGITAFQLSEVAMVELYALSLLPARAFSLLILPNTQLFYPKGFVPPQDLTAIRPAVPSKPTGPVEL